MNKTGIEMGEDRKMKGFQKLLLICGILSSLVYVGGDLFAATQWEGYSYLSQSVSELQAIGAPTRPLIVSAFTLYNLLVVAFGAGILATQTIKRARITGILLMIYGILGQIGLMFFPMHLRGSEKSMSDTLHIIFTGVLVLLMLLYIVFGSTLYGKPFRLYSFATIFIMLLFGAWAGMDGPNVAAQLPTPFLGVTERICIVVPLIWKAVLAAKTLRANKSKAYADQQMSNKIA